MITIMLNSYAMIGPSVTTYTGNNMGYRIYTIDGDHTNTTNVRQWDLLIINTHNIYTV